MFQNTKLCIIQYYYDMSTVYLNHYLLPTSTPYKSLSLNLNKPVLFIDMHTDMLLKHMYSVVLFVLYEFSPRKQYA